MAQYLRSVMSRSNLAEGVPERKPTAKRLTTFLDTRRAAKWHKDIAACTNSWTIRPVTTGSTPALETSFPYARTQQLTKQYLGRITTQEDTDRRLLELIKDVGRREVAFAACASYLSIDAVQNFLKTEFKSSTSDNAVVIEPYLQAFVAAAYCKSLEFAKADETFATKLVAVTYDADATQAATLHKLILAWKAGPPIDEGLRTLAFSLTAVVIRNAGLRLHHCHSSLSWSTAIQYQASLLLLDETFQTAGPDFEGYVNTFFPRWRCWTKWAPHARSTGAATQHLRAQFNKLNCLQVLEEPDLVQGDGFGATVWQGLILRGQLISYLESAGFKIGVGLIVGDTEWLLMEFMEQFRRVVDMALQDGASSTRLLTMYVDREGLDCGTLSAWEDARKLLIKPLPKFVEYIVNPKAEAAPNDKLDILAGQALEALRPAQYQTVRNPIIAEIAQCVQLAHNGLQTEARSREWFAPALRLWDLRKRLADSEWLHLAVEETVLEESKRQLLRRCLQVLGELHVEVATLGNRRLNEELASYVYSFVADGEATYGKQLGGVLHALWTDAHDRDIREAAITLAALDDVRLDIRAACIASLAGATRRTATQLQECLLLVQAKVAVAYMDLTEVIVSLSAVLLNEPCWAALLQALLKRDDVSVLQHDFTDRGYKAYLQWLHQLHTLFDQSFDSPSRMHYDWLQQLGGPLEPVLSALEAMEGSKRVMHRVLTATADGTRKRYLNILTCISHVYQQGRRGFMFTLLLLLNADNASSICSAISACAWLSDDEVTHCPRFFVLAQKDKDLAAARLNIWLNMSDFSPALKATLIDIGEIMELKDGMKAWLAAKKHYDTRVHELVARVKELEEKRIALMRTSRSEVEQMVDDLGLQVPGGFSAILAELPAELADVVEEIAEDQLELHFTLGNLHSLMRLALGVQGTETVIVTLRSLGYGAVDAYCVHLEEAVSDSRITHTWTEWAKGKPAPTQFSCSSKQTRLSYVVARAVWRALGTGETDIAKLYASVKATIQSGANECIICAKDIGARLHRAIAHRRNLALLPEIPKTWSDSTKILAVLNKLPATEVLAKANDMLSSLRVRLPGRQADVFVSWLCNASRTFIISATGQWRIPNMPAIHQFLVVDNPPEVEAAFAKHNHLQPRMVLFHGTSMDRLYPILAQGLRVLSNTSLMRNGAAHGSGIYTSGETSVAAGYAVARSNAGSALGFFNSRRDFDGPQVLLGCEHAGPAKTSGINVVTDSTKVIVRYIFLAAPGVVFPMAKDVIAPMVSTFHSLRASAATST